MKFFGGVGRGSSVAAWLSLTGALHGCVYNRTAAHYPGEGHSKVKTARKATGNHLGYFPYRHDAHRRLLRGCRAAVAAVLRRRLPPDK